MQQVEPQVELPWVLLVLLPLLAALLQVVGKPGLVEDHLGSLAVVVGSLEEGNQPGQVGGKPPDQEVLGSLADWEEGSQVVPGDTQVALRGSQVVGKLTWGHSVLVDLDKAAC